MKVLYIVKTQLHYYPPCISQIRMLKDLGYDVEVLYGTSNESALKLLAKENIPCHKVAEIKDVASSKIEKLQDWYKFRCGVLNALKQYPEDTVLWFGTAESALPMKGVLNGKKYVLSLLELLDDCPQKVRLLKNLAQNAAAVTVCEETISCVRGGVFRKCRMYSRTSLTTRLLTAVTNLRFLKQKQSLNESKTKKLFCIRGFCRTRTRFWKSLRRCKRWMPGILCC